MRSFSATAISISRPRDSKQCCKWSVARACGLSFLMPVATIPSKPRCNDRLERGRSAAVSLRSSPKVRRFPQPGLEICLLFRSVRDDVLAATGRTQEPFTYGSLSGQAFYFRAAGMDANTTAPTPEQQSQPQVNVALRAPSSPAPGDVQPQQTAGPPDLATTLEGVWYGDVISDSKGGSRS